MRRPVDIPPARIGGDRAAHAARGVGPATDYPCPIGTPILAPFAGTTSHYVTSTGGLGVILRGTGATFYGQHLWVRMPGGAYAEGDRIALSGNTGSATTGPHLHAYVIVHATGERLSVEEYLARQLTPEPASIPLVAQEESMFIAIVRKTDWYLVTGGKACLLGAHSGARASGAPILNFPDDWAVKQLQSVVSGIK